MTQTDSVPELDDDDKGEIIEEKVESLTPAMPGWFACYTDEKNTRVLNIYPIAAFAIVQLTYEDSNVYRVVRPYVAKPDGEISDVLDFENFLCLSGPGQDPRIVANEAREEKGETKLIVPGA